MGAFERAQKPHNSKLTKLFARNQATPHISVRERRRSEADIKAANWVLPTSNDMEERAGMKLRQGGRNRPFSATDPRNVTTNSQKLRYVLEGLGYGGEKKAAEAPWPGQRTTNGALDPAAR